MDDENNLEYNRHIAIQTDFSGNQAMTRFTSSLFLFAASLAFFAVAGTGLAATGAGPAPDVVKTLTIAADSWCPLNCDPAVDGVEGVGVDLARKIFEPLGYKVDYIIMPWARALEESRQGRIDAVVGANEGDDPTLVYPREGIFFINDGIYVLESSPLEFSDMDSLNGYRLGVIKDYGYSEKVQNYMAAHRNIPGAVQEVAGETALEQNIKKLLAGRIDALVDSAAVVSYTLGKMGIEEKVRNIGLVPQGEVYLGFSPARPDAGRLAAEFDKGIENLRSTGELQNMYAPYKLDAKR